MVLADSIPKEKRSKKRKKQRVRTIYMKRKIELFKIVWDGDNLLEEIRDKVRNATNLISREW